MVSKVAPLAEPSASWSRREVLGSISAGLLLASCNATRATAPLPENPDAGDSNQAANGSDLDTPRPLTAGDAGEGESGTGEATSGESSDVAETATEGDIAETSESDSAQTTGSDSGDPMESDAGGTATEGTLPDAGPTPQCVETEDNILGPFYREGAPERSVLTDPEFPGEALIIEGTVSGLNASCVPLAGALLDVWQANAAAEYDLTDPRFLFRGKLRSGADGSYQFSTVLPGRYLNGSVYRPRHIHLIASVEGYITLTTQIYFADDPYLAVDPFVHPQLVIPLRLEGNTWRGQFPIVLLPV